LHYLIPTILIAYLAEGVGTGLATTVTFILIQQLDNTFVVPKVMSDVVGLKPIAVLLGIISGFAIAGALGAIFAIPVIVLLQIAYEFYIDLQKLKAEGIV
jgi:predicted PurR-regulated permease PerM